jgi:hypothetical protein
LPTYEDYSGSVTALHRLEDTYLLRPVDIRKGNIGLFKSIRELNGDITDTY